MSVTTTGSANGLSQDESNGTASGELGLSGLYPTQWDEVIGQEKAKRQLRTAAKAALIRGKSLPHTLIHSGTPGIGKTSLALLLAAEMGTQVKVVSGRIKVTEARMVFADLSDGDVAIFEECHSLVSTSKNDVDWLKNYMENGVIVGPLGAEEQPKVTIIGTTTDMGKLPDTILDRFELKAELTTPTLDEAAKIAALMSLRLFIGLTRPTAENCYAVAKAANQNPRLIRGLLATLSDVALVDPERVAGEDGYDIAPILEDAGTTSDGLSSVAQRFLICLHADFRGEPAGIQSIKERMREPGGLEYVERVLLDKGLISFTGRGRILTSIGLKRAKSLRGL